MSDFENLIDAAKQGALENVRNILESHPEIVNLKDTSGATALHYAAFGGHCRVVELLVQHGANINARDNKYGATPAGWAIEYLREMGGFLGIELSDFAHALRKGDSDWAARFLKRFPKLCDAADEDGTPFRKLAAQSGNSEIIRMFESRAL